MIALQVDELDDKRSAADFSALQQAVRSGVGRKLAMHVVAAKPAFLNAETVPAVVVEKETAIFR